MCQPFHRLSAIATALLCLTGPLAPAYAFSHPTPSSSLSTSKRHTALSSSSRALITPAPLLAQAQIDNAKPSAASPEQETQLIGLLQHTATIYKTLGDPVLEGQTLESIGYLLAQQNQPELAIVFYKKAIEVLESVRRNLRNLPPEKQIIFGKTFASTYRDLADLLLAQSRVHEAHDVLDRHKFQELDDYLQTVPNHPQFQSGITTHPQEEKIWQHHSQIRDRSIQLGKELSQLRQIPAKKRSQQQIQRIGEIEQQMQKARQDFNNFIRHPEIVALAQHLNRTASGQNLDLPNLNRLQRQLRQLESTTVLLYPLILENRLELILVTPYAPPLRRTVPVSRKQFNQAIVKLRASLTDRIKPPNWPIAPAHKLYNWLIKPIENDLKQANAKTILYAPDGPLRYIPLAALHDGDRWLIERFSINNITAATLTDLTNAESFKPKVLAGAFATGNYKFQVGTRQFSLAGLKFAEPEVNNIAAQIPRTTKLINDNFNLASILPQLNDHNIIHFATHAAFVKGKPEDSFILLGNGDRVTLREVESWNLTAVDLIVLSACQTATGQQLGDGVEVLGLGYQMQQAGALATIASLWSVDDEGTKLLMDVLYKQLQKGKTSKIEALRQAQISLIQSDRNHPYYWAPFILIGNGL